MPESDHNAPLSYPTNGSKRDKLGWWAANGPTIVSVMITIFIMKVLVWLRDKYFRPHMPSP